MVCKLKVFFFAALLSASPLDACADIITLFTPKMNWSVSNGIEFEMRADGTLRSACMDVSAECDMTELVFKSGLRVRPDAVDFSAQAVWWPTLLRYFN
ncbi:MAG: hypothetical protein K2H09_00470, partial [Treponemataceae bacterium]|nr:hypothetical protein [Treponemataceae bacterium]